jgi:hypothetical protein
MRIACKRPHRKSAYCLHRDGVKRDGVLRIPEHDPETACSRSRSEGENRVSETILHDQMPERPQVSPSLGSPEILKDKRNEMAKALPCLAGFYQLVDLFYLFYLFQLRTCDAAAVCCSTQTGIVLTFSLAAYA